MLNICIYQCDTPINTTLVKNLIIIETQYEGTFNINLFKSKSQLENILNENKSINIIFFNELSIIDQFYDIVIYIREKTGNPNVLFVFPTMYANSLAQNLYKLGSVTFISDIASCEQISEILFYWEQHCGEMFFAYKNNRKRIFVHYSDIMYFEGERRYIHIKTKFGEDKFIGKMNDLYKQIYSDNSLFLRTHQSYIINMINIKSVCAHSVTMIDNSVIPISNNYLESVNHMLMFIDRLKANQTANKVSYSEK